VAVPEPIQAVPEVCSSATVSAFSKRQLNDCAVAGASRLRIRGRESVLRPQDGPRSHCAHPCNGSSACQHRRLPSEQIPADSEGSGVSLTGVLALLSLDSLHKKRPIRPIGAQDGANAKDK
jgi:hypothetical protein